VSPKLQACWLPKGVDEIDERLYVGLATGSLQIYSYEPQPDGGLPSAKLLSSVALGKKPLEQVGVMIASKQLLVLSGMSAS
jgi:hypothetical protein